MDTGKDAHPWAGDVRGGLASMLVALPIAIAFGVTIFAILGVGYAAQEPWPAFSVPPPWD